MKSHQDRKTLLLFYVVDFISRKVLWNLAVKMIALRYLFYDFDTLVSLWELRLCKIIVILIRSCFTYVIILGLTMEGCFYTDSLIKVSFSSIGFYGYELFAFSEFFLSWITNSFTTPIRVYNEHSDKSSPMFNFESRNSMNFCGS